MYVYISLSHIHTKYFNKIYINKSLFEIHIYKIKHTHKLKGIIDRKKRVNIFIFLIYIVVICYLLLLLLLLLLL